MRSVYNFDCTYLNLILLEIFVLIFSPSHAVVLLLFLLPLFSYFQCMFLLLYVFSTVIWYAAFPISWYCPFILSVSFSSVHMKCFVSLFITNLVLMQELEFLRANEAAPAAKGPQTKLSFNLVLQCRYR